MGITTYFNNDFHIFKHDNFTATSVICDSHNMWIAVLSSHQDSDAEDNQKDESRRHSRKGHSQVLETCSC